MIAVLLAALLRRGVLQWEGPRPALRFRRRWLSDGCLDC